MQTQPPFCHRDAMDSIGQPTRAYTPSRLAKSCGATALLLTAFSLTGCPSITNPYTPEPMPDYNVFIAQIQPFVGRSCAFSGCHGTRGESLTLYAVDYLRAPSQFSDTPLDEKHLTDAEISWNFDALRMRIRDASSAEQSRLVLKCLDPKQGGIRHGGDVVIFADRTDPGYKMLVSWVA